MINDHWRNNFFYNALQKTAKDKVVLDVGSGTGILAFYALAAGAKFVYCVERDSAMCSIIESVLSKKFPRSKFKVVDLDFWTDTVDGQIEHNSIDIIISETLGPGLFDEGMFHTWHCVKPFLKQDAISIPDRLHCDIWTWPSSMNTDMYQSDANQVSLLTRSALIDDDFADSLIKVDRELESDKDVIKWISLNKIKQQPLAQYQDIVSYTMHQGPNLMFTSDHYPRHIVPEISFEFDIEEPCKISIINKISFQDSTIYLKDTQHTLWKFVPTIDIIKPGRYIFTYNNPDLHIMQKTEWLYKIKESHQ